MTVDEETREQNPAEEPEEEQPEAGAGEEEEAEEPQPEGEEEESAKKPKKSAQKRIRELTAKYRQTEREVKELRQLLNEQRQKGEQTPSQTPPKKPTRDQFEDEDEYIEAVADWKTSQKLQEREQTQQQQQRKQKEQEEQERIGQAVQTINEQGMNEFEDYEDVVFENDALTITDNMVHAISEMDYGHRVAYHLGNNPDRAAKIAEMSPYRQATELGKIERDLTQKPKKKQPKTPPPTEPVKGGGESGESEPSDINDWMKHRRKQVYGR